MSTPPPPPPPASGPSLPASADVQNFCLLHKGPVQGEVYECPNCHQRYCRSCVVDAKEKGGKRFCVKCKTIFLL
ncbi:MAG: hypothetical protein ACTSU5_14900 [Promethearchaeota archaeon]